MGGVACYPCMCSCQARVRLLACFWLVLRFLVHAGLASVTSSWSPEPPYMVESSTIVCRSDGEPSSVHFVIS